MPGVLFVCSIIATGLGGAERKGALHLRSTESRLSNLQALLKLKVLFLDHTLMRQPEQLCFPVVIRTMISLIKAIWNMA